MILGTTSRRRFIAGVAALIPAAMTLPGIATAQTRRSRDNATTPTAEASENGGPFKLPPLPYGYDALEPHIDARTMRIHHDKHHAAYVNKLNDAVKKASALRGKSLREMISNLDDVPEDVRKDIRNQGGGHINHTLFWHIMSPGGNGKPTGKLAEAIDSAFGSFEDFKSKFQESGGKVFGSGWVWLVSRDGKLDIMTTSNQDNPLSEGAEPMLGNDVWEHAYYLKYQNARADYLKAWWKVVNWDQVAKGFEAGRHSVINLEPASA